MENRDDGAELVPIVEQIMRESFTRIEAARQRIPQAQCRSEIVTSVLLPVAWFRRLSIVASFLLAALSLALCYSPSVRNQVWAGMTILAAGAASVSLCAEIFLGAGRHFSSLMAQLDRHWREVRFEPSTSSLSLIATLLTSMIALVSGFALVYTAYGESFSTRVAGTSAIYFSVVTFATVGYGDIAPTDDLGRWLVVCQICTSFLLVIIIVSSTVGWALNRESHRGQERLEKLQRDEEYKDLVLREAKVGLYADEEMKSLHAKIHKVSDA